MSRKKPQESSAWRKWPCAPAPRFGIKPEIDTSKIPIEGLRRIEGNRVAKQAAHAERLASKTLQPQNFAPRPGLYRAYFPYCDTMVAMIYDEVNNRCAAAFCNKKDKAFRWKGFEEALGNLNMGPNHRFKPTHDAFACTPAYVLTGAILGGHAWNTPERIRAKVRKEYDRAALTRIGLVSRIMVGRAVKKNVGEFPKTEDVLIVPLSKNLQS